MIVHFYCWFESFLPFLISIVKLYAYWFSQYLYIFKLYYREETIRFITCLYVIINFVGDAILFNGFFVCFIIIRNYIHILIVNFEFHYMVTNVENFLDNVNRILPNQIRILGNVFDFLNLYMVIQWKLKILPFNDRVCCMNVLLIIHLLII